MNAVQNSQHLTAERAQKKRYELAQVPEPQTMEERLRRLEQTAA